MQGMSMLQFVNEMVVDIWQPNLLEHIQRQDFDPGSEKRAPLFLLVLNLNGYFVPSAVKLDLDKETACARVGYIWKFRRNIGPVTLASRTLHSARPQTIASNDADSMNWPCLDIYEPSADPKRARETHGLDWIIEAKSEFVLECS